VSFVGSTPVARHVYATATQAGKRVQALGGLNDQLANSVSGGYYNTARGNYATVSGGGNNFARGYYSCISGGGWNTTSSTVTPEGMISGYGAVSGGLYNTGKGDGSTVSGGSHIVMELANGWAAGSPGDPAVPAFSQAWFLSPLITTP